MIENRAPTIIDGSFTLSSLRKRLGLTLEDVACHFEMSERTLRRYEEDSGQVKAWLIKEFAKLYCISSSKIYIGKEENFNKLLQRNGGFRANKAHAG